MQLPLAATAHYLAPFILASTKLGTAWLQSIHDEYHTKSPAAIAGLALRKAYFYDAVRVLTKIKRECATCSIHQPKDQPMEIAAVPEHRISGVPGNHLSLDTVGPFLTLEKPGHMKTRRTRNHVLKTFALIATDTYSRRFFVELMEDLSVTAMMDALQSIFTRSGKPTTISADAGSSFQAAADQGLIDPDNSEDESGEVLHLEPAIMDQVTEQLAQQQVQMYCHLPKAPWRNGCSESLIGVMKKQLRIVYRPNYRWSRVQLHHCLQRIAHQINSRPICYQPGMEATEFHLLSPNSLAPCHDPESCSQVIQDPTLGERHDQVIAALKKFQELHCEIYSRRLLSMQGMPPRKVQQLDPGDLVLLKDKKNSNGLPAMAKIISIDGTNANVVYISKIGRKIYLSRPIQTLPIVLKTTSSRREIPVDPYKLFTDATGYELEDKESGITDNQPTNRTNGSELCRPRTISSSETSEITPTTSAEENEQADSSCQEDLSGGAVAGSSRDPHSDHSDTEDISPNRDHRTGRENEEPDSSQTTQREEDNKSRAKPRFKIFESHDQ